MRKSEWVSIIKAANKRKTIDVERLNIPGSVLGISKWPSGHLIGSTDEQLNLIEKIKQYHPELASWSQMSILESWGWYSQDCLLITTSECNSRDCWYLGYLYMIYKGEAVGRWNGDTEKAEIGYQGLLELSRKN